MSMLTEDQIERRVEKMTDHLDRCLMTGGLLQRDYDAAMKQVSRWADAQSSCLPRHERLTYGRAPGQE